MKIDSSGMTEVVRQALLRADMDSVAEAIDKATGERVSIWGVSAHASEIEQDTIHGVFEGEILNRPKGVPNGVYLEFKVKVTPDE